LTKNKTDKVSSAKTQNPRTSKSQATIATQTEENSLSKDLQLVVDAAVAHLEQTLQTCKIPSYLMPMILLIQAQAPKKLESDDDSALKTVELWMESIEIVLNELSHHEAEQKNSSGDSCNKTVAENKLEVTSGDTTYPFAGTAIKNRNLEAPTHGGQSSLTALNCEEGMTEEIKV